MSWITPANDPPPRGQVEALMAQSGFVVYEDGTNIFDESVLVYVAQPRREFPDFDVFDHAGRRLGIARRDRFSPTLRMQNHDVYYDLAGNEILRIRPQNTAFDLTFHITGFSSGKASSGASTIADLTIKADNRRCGVIVGSKVRGLVAPSLAILDDREKQVGEIKVFKEGSFLTSVRHYVVSVKPGLRGPLRRLLVAVPTMVTSLKSPLFVDPD